MKKILVTGGAGFIGSNLVHYLVNQGCEVTVLDKLTYAGSKENLADISSTVRLLVGDICDASDVRESLKDTECVVHLAAESHNTRSETNPDLFYKTNVDGTQTMLTESFQRNIKKFIHVSTDEVYGPIESGYFSEDDKLEGDSQATSAYSKSKSIADDLAMEKGRKGYPVIVVRPTNNFGPWQYPEKALPRWITNLLLGEKIPLWSPGLQVRDWLYAPETCRAIEFLISNGEEANAYNIAANNVPEITNRKAAEWICELLGLSPEEGINFIPDPRPNHDFRYALTTDKIKKLGFTMENEPYEQFKQTVQWYKKNAAWWKARKEEAESIYR
jgi:dTDP-glucose 4,6-dehydratase